MIINLVNKTGITPTGTINITSNGVTNVADYESANVQVPSATLTTASVTPTTSSQTITPELGVDGFDEINVSAVTSSIDANIVAGNIKKDVAILGVTGTLEEGITPTGTISITANGTGIDVSQYANADVAVNPTLDTLSVTPTTSSQSLTPPAGTDGYNLVNVSAVDSSIDANIVAGNIKKDVAILGVTGTYEGSGGSTAFGLTAAQWSGYLSSGKFFKGTKTGVDFTGIQTIVSYGMKYMFYGATLVGAVTFPDLTDIDSSSLEQAFYNVSGVTSLSMPSLTTITGSYGMSNCFYGCMSITTVSMSSLTTISNNYAMQSCFQGCTHLTSASFPALTTISGSSVMYKCFQGCTQLNTVDLSALTTVSNSSVMSNCFYGCSALTTISMPSITTLSGSSAMYNCFRNCTSLTSVTIGGTTAIDFGSATNQFSGMFQGCSQDITVNAPAASQTTIEAMSGYPTFGGTGNVVWNWIS